MLDAQITEQLAQKLDEAERTKTQIGILSIAHPDMDIGDAYRVQDAWTRIKLARGRTIRGRKIGLTSRAMQMSVGIDTPDSGILFDDMFYDSGAIIPFTRYHAARIEVEIAFVMARPLRGPHCTIFDVLDATAYVCPALEILETRLLRVDPATGKTRKVVDTIADNAANAALVVGGRPMRPDALDLRWVSALLSRNGQIEETGVSAGVMGHPAASVAWLANHLSQSGQAIAAGELVLSGSFTRPAEISKGDTFHADYGPFGSVACHFSGD